MSRPGDNITIKSILMTQKLKDMDKKEIFSKSLLANVLDIDDNFCASKISETNSIVHYNHSKGPLGLNGCFAR